MQDYELPISSPSKEEDGNPRTFEQAIRIVRKYEETLRLKAQSKFSCEILSIKLDYEPEDLMDALSQGVAYRIKDGKVYVWNSGGIMRSVRDGGFYLLIGYEVLRAPQTSKYLENTVKFKLSLNQKL